MVAMNNNAKLTVIFASGCFLVVLVTCGFILPILYRQMTILKNEQKVIVEDMLNTLVARQNLVKQMEGELHRLKSVKNERLKEEFLNNKLKDNTAAQSTNTRKKRNIDGVDKIIKNNEINPVSNYKIDRRRKKRSLARNKFHRSWNVLVNPVGDEKKYSNAYDHMGQSDFSMLMDQPVMPPSLEELAKLRGPHHQSSYERYGFQNDLPGPPEDGGAAMLDINHGAIESVDSTIDNTDSLSIGPRHPSMVGGPPPPPGIGQYDNNQRGKRTYYHESAESHGTSEIEAGRDDSRFEQLLAELAKTGGVVEIDCGCPNGNPGKPGPLGPAGKPGVPGIQGVDGTPGRPGPDGQPGSPGVNGKTGPQGLSGRTGNDGRDGNSGQPGRPGPDGNPGRDGQPGRDGINGSPGKDGEPGRDGDSGASGEPGKDGLDGLSGKPGLDGASGLRGPPGGKGSDGRPGPPGRDGAPGKDGLPGKRGRDGAHGIDNRLPGPEGDSGIPGHDGSPGIPGADGKPGVDGNPGRDGNPGNPGKDGEPGQPGIDSPPGKDGNPGNPGVDGQPGNSGPDAKPGHPGNRGSPGERGNPGKDGISGNPGRDGLPGVDGKRGPDGRQGEDGQPGLDGEAGRDGRDGKPGDRGRDGLPGIDGKPGNDGRGGATGPVGPKGSKGISGLPGADGIPGNPGIDGSPGPPGDIGPIGSSAGNAGRPGNDGRPGAPGIPGTPGIRGNSGAPGKPGSIGGKGDTGSNGRDGESGIPGIPGKDGVPGSLGVPGKCLNECVDDNRKISLCGGSLYVRWGKKTCGDEAVTSTLTSELIYSGYVAGGHYADSYPGGGHNYLCLPETPNFGNFVDGFSTGTNGEGASKIYGAEYRVYDDASPFLVYQGSLKQKQAVCAVCYTASACNHIMLPGFTECPSGFGREYQGYLMALNNKYCRSQYICVDQSPDYHTEGDSTGDGSALYVVESKCGALPCNTYSDGAEISCVVCAKN